MNLRAMISSNSFVRGILVISLFALIFIFSVTYKHTIALRESTEILIRSYKIQGSLEQLFSCLRDAEIGQRGYLISRDSAFLNPYYSARSKSIEPYMQLDSLITNNPQQQDNLDSLWDFINLRFALLAHSLELDNEPDINKSRLDENMVRGDKVMDKIRSQINNMIDLESLDFNEHQKDLTHDIYFTPNWTLFLLFFSLLVFVFSFIKINNNLIDLKKTNEYLNVTNESFRHAEDIGNFCSWRWFIDTNKFVFSDNQYRLLGCAPQSFEPTLENFLEFVHPEDRHIITDGVTLALKKAKPTSAFFRVIRNDGELRYFKSVSRLAASNGGKLLIGINSDITEQHISNMALEERNRELELSNKELASFNHIASHDLQEPLRKIQTFVSRITEKESSNLSETGKEYFIKVQSSLIHMRNLIDDLLQFSRATKTEKKFELVDLTLLLENAIQELIQDIEEKKAEINTSQLPVLNVIPFQIQQLFINLIGNALKYSQQHIVPVITINYDVINSDDYPFLKYTDQKKYHRIAIKDNGLGFEQQYAEDIFQLFYRLLPKAEMTGSGIGLSICKKIVENHKGFIFAESTPGIGSTFSVFLP
jgi:signal transduction histidine kinase/CHASE3 domain sensor protein